jgi:hypothetical protein
VREIQVADLAEADQAVDRAVVAQVVADPELVVPVAAAQGSLPAALWFLPAA